MCDYACIIMRLTVLQMAAGVDVWWVSHYNTVNSTHESDATADYALRWNKL